MLQSISNDPPPEWTAETDPGRWLVRLRWAAMSGVVAVVTVAEAVGVVGAVLPLLGVAVLMGGANLALALLVPPARSGRSAWLTAQILLDVASLTALLHFSGGADNPFVVLFVLPMVVAAMVLPLRTGLLLALAATVLFGTVVLLESSGLLPHHSLEIGAHHLFEHSPGAAMWRSSLFMTGYLSALLLTLSGTVVFVHALAQRFRQAEAARREHERLAETRERLARIGALSGGVAHAVRNPLHAMLSCLEIVRRRLTSDDPAVGEALDMMGKGIDRIERVTRRLLALGGEQPATRMAVDLRDLLAEALSFVEAQANGRGVALSRELAELPKARVEADRILDALVGVLENAVRACAEGDSVSVRLCAPGGDGGGARIVVEDTGCGMPPEVKARVFDPFFTTRPIGEGTGLGLAIARRVVADHGGRVELESQAGGGTMVAMALPREVFAT